MENLLNDLKYMKEVLTQLEDININDIDMEKTILFIVDMNNGFARKGSLYSDRVENLINPIKNLGDYVASKNCKVVAFTDSHTKDSIELHSYQTHCLSDDEESDVVSEIKAISNIKIVPKNSTNGFFCLNEISFKNIENIIIVGDCTDICIYQFAVTLKSYFNQNNIYKKIIVPMNLVDTYDIPKIHNAEIMNIVFFNSMIQNGVQVIKNIIYK
ncbi:isochorismatase family cysteine hydrolase [Paraclostridium benzoelyticum]|nr:isochorismatase family cysteine hydrolase [Paraclostridium benzoelyticum]